MLEIFRRTSGNKGLRNSGGKDLFLEKYSQLFCLSEKLPLGRGINFFTVRPRMKVVKTKKKLIVNLKILSKLINLEGIFPKYVFFPWNVLFPPEMHIENLVKTQILLQVSFIKRFVCVAPTQTKFCRQSVWSLSQ